MSDGCFRARRQICDEGFHLGTRLDDQQNTGDDEFITLELIGLVQHSLTCEILSPEDFLIRMEEEDRLQKIEEEEKRANEEPAADGHIDDELNLSDYYMQLFGITADDHTPLDETHLGICCEEPALQYRSRPNWVMA